MGANDETIPPDATGSQHSITEPEKQNTAGEHTQRNATSQDAGEHHVTISDAPLEQARKDPLTTASSQDGGDVEKQTEEPKQEEQEKDGRIMGRSKGKVAVIMLALCLAIFLAALDVTIVTTALPTISEHFHSASGYTWIGSAFLLANAASIPSWGKVSDIFGRKPMILVANVIFMVGSLVAALSDSIGMLIAARVVQGIGGGGLIILVNILIGDLFPLRIRGAFYGVIGGVWAIASSLGPIVGGAFTQGVSWRWCFYVNLPLDGLAFFILLFFLDIKTPRTPLVQGLKAIDWIGTLLIVGGTLLFLFGLQYGGETAPWDSAEVLCLIIIGVFTLFLFAMWEWKFAKYPIMPMALFGSLTNCATFAVVFLHGLVFISASYYLPLYFQGIRGATPILSGVDLLPTALSLAAGSLGTGVFVAKTGMFLPPIYFAFFMMTLGYGLFIDFDAHSSWTKLIIFQIIAGLGVGPCFQAPIIALQAHIAPRDIGTGTATLGFVRQLATTTSVVIGEVVFQNQMRRKTPELASVLNPQQLARVSGGNAGANTEFIDQLQQPAKNVVRVAFADSLQPMWIMYTCFAALGLIVMFFVKRKKLTRQHEETKTGLEAEKANAEARAAERQAKRESKMSSKRNSRFPEGGDASRPTTANASRPTTRPQSSATSEFDKEKEKDEEPVPGLPKEYQTTT
ncbi:MFS-type transporter [Lecanosticta acicola]|uniref:Efflux pump dotC n=1 Tax=Lecanosticta acicola TaxID=111012 RepID=A0AAI8Z1K2_9PEZI|nr:MFS-type transporter [Lecanosticta acicola]